MADLANSDISAIVSHADELVIRHPGTGKAVGLTVTLLPNDSDEVKKVARSITNRRLKLAARGKNFTADELDDNEISLLVAAVTGWKWTVDAEGKHGSFGGEQLPFNPINVRKILAVGWIKSQISEHMGETEAFFRK